MSGFEVVGLVLACYPLVEGAIDLYRATKTRRSAATLTRRLRTESVIFQQFVQKLIAPNVSDKDMKILLDPKNSNRDLWQAPTLNQKLRMRLGEEKADLILDIVREIDRVLKSLKAELSNVSHGIEVLVRLRTGLRVAKHNMEKSEVQRQLAYISSLNGDLTRLLDESEMTPPTKSTEDSQPSHFLLKDCRQAIELYDFIRQEGYKCDCNEPHITNFGLRYPAHTTLLQLRDVKNYKWEFELLFPPKNQSESEPSEPTMPEVLAEALDELQKEEDEGSRRKSSDDQVGIPITKERSRSISITEFNQGGNDQDHGCSPFPDLCSFINNISADENESSDETNGQLGIIGTEKKKYKLCIKLGNKTEPMNIVSLEELLRPSQLLRNYRMQLALRLSSSILQFYRTKWIKDDWTSKDLSVLNVVEKEDDELPRLLFVTRRFYSANLEPQPEAVSPLWSYDDPILTKLGFALIEIALGQTLAEYSKDHRLGKTTGDPDFDFFLNLQAANMVLKSNLIARQESQGYQNVVKACIRHEYPGSSNLGPQRLNSDDAYFLDKAEDSIIRPLYAECDKAWGVA